MKLILLIVISGLLSACSYKPSRSAMNSAAAINSIAEEDEECLMRELFDPNAPAQQNINPNTTMPMMPHTVKEIDFFRNSTSDAKCCVAPVLASSSINYTLSCCAPDAPGTSSP